MDQSDKANDLGALVKESVFESGVLENLKSIKDSSPKKAEDTQELRHQVKAVIEDVQQMLSGGRFDDSTVQKLRGLLSKLQSTLGKGEVSREALSAALTEANSAISTVSETNSSAVANPTKEQLWSQVAAENKEIDDDFVKMQKAGIVFNQGLLNRHKKLMEYLESHPQDLSKQKELDAIDDAMLMQAKPQLSNCPEAQELFTNAQAKSDDRHKIVDKKLADTVSITKQAGDFSSADFDDRPAAQNLTMEDVKSQSVGQKEKNSAKSHRV